MIKFRRFRALLVLGALLVPAAGSGSGHAAGAWAHAGPYATARWGTCNPSIATSSSTTVEIHYPMYYRVFRSTVVAGKCRAVGGFYPAFEATTYTWSPTAAKLVAPSDFGPVNVTWTATNANPDPISGSGPWAWPLPLDAGFWVEVQRPATASGSVGSYASGSSLAASTYIAVVAGGGGVYG